MRTPLEKIYLLALALTLVLFVGVFGCFSEDDSDDRSDSGAASDDDDSFPAPDDDTPTDDDDDDDDDSTDDDDDDDVVECDWETHDPLIVQGKDYLEQGLPYESYEAFADALAVCPDSVDARFGMAMADQLDLERIAYDFLLYVLTNPLTPKDDKGFGTMSQIIIRELLIPKAEEMAGYAKVVRETPDSWSFYLDAYPFILEDNYLDDVIVDLGGEWDHADAIQLEAQAQFYLGFFHLLCAYDITIDYGWMTGFPSLSGTIIEILNEMAAWFLSVLNDPDYPMFLTLLDDVGNGHLENARLSFGRFYLLMAEASEKMLTETDNQDNDVSGYYDANENGQWDEGEPYKLPWVGYLSNDQNLAWLGLMKAAESAGASTLDGTALDVNPDRGDWFWLSELNFFLQSLGLSPFLPPIPVSLSGIYDQDDESLKDTIRTLTMLLYVITQP